MPGEVRSALRHEPPNRRRELERLWSLLGRAESRRRPVTPTTDEAWDSLRRTMQQDLSTRAAPDRGPRMRRRTLAAVSAVTVLLIGLSVTWLHLHVTTDVPAGDQRTVTLPDGSTATLNSATTLSHARGFRAFPFGMQRVVRLRGEAFFSVVAADDPFVVETDHARIQVLGTAFNVRARSGAAENGTVVTLSEGTVRVSSRRLSGHDVLLRRAGETASVPNASEPPGLQTGTLASLEHVLAWRRRGFAVVDRPLEAVLNEVERRYAIEIAPRDGVDLSDSMNLFYLRGASPDQILRDICLVQGCAYRETSSGFALADAPSGANEDGLPSDTPQ